jgi:hypothetical protein
MPPRLAALANALLGMIDIDLLLRLMVSYSMMEGGELDNALKPLYLFTED